MHRLPMHFHGFADRMCVPTSNRMDSSASYIDRPLPRPGPAAKLETPVSEDR